MSASTNLSERYKQLFRDSYAELLAYSRSLVGVDDAPDVVEDAFLDLWQRRTDLDMNGNLRAFLYGSVYTRSLNVLKHRKVTDSYLELVMALHAERDHACNAMTPETHYANDELRGAIDTAIGDLPEKCRMVFRMSYEQGMLNKEIASVLEISPKTVEVHISKALRQLRRALANMHKTLVLVLVLSFFK